MKTEIELNEELLAKARELSGIEGTDELVQEALNELSERDSARRLENLGGSEPQLLSTPRRKLEPPKRSLRLRSVSAR